MSYLSDAEYDAAEMVRYFEDEIIDQILDTGSASNDLFNDYPSGDRYHHETHVDKAYDLSEAAKLLEELSDYEETDYGLWEGLKPREAISCQAAFTYGNAVCQLWQTLIENLNDEATDVIGALEDKYDDEDELRAAQKAAVKELIDKVEEL